MNIENHEQETVIDRLIQVKETLPRKQKQLSNYILKNYQSIGLITVKELADNANVGVSTVMRLVKALDYDNFNDFRKDIYNALDLPTTKWTYSIKSYTSSESNRDGDEDNTIYQVWKEAINILDKSLTPDLIENFQKAIEMMLQASQINILGTRPYRATALYLELLLGEFYSKIRQLSHDTEILYDRILQFDKDEILFIFAFEPYTYRTVEAAKVAYDQGNKIILVTDHISCPIVPYATVTIKLEYSIEQFSVIPIIALIEALVIEMGKNTEDSIKKMEKLQQTLENNLIQKSLGYKWNLIKK